MNRSVMRNSGRDILTSNRVTENLGKKKKITDNIPGEEREKKLVLNNNGTRNPYAQSI